MLGSACSLRSTNPIGATALITPQRTSIRLAGVPSPCAKQRHVAAGLAQVGGQAGQLLQQHLGRAGDQDVVVGAGLRRQIARVPPVPRKSRVSRSMCSEALSARPTGRGAGNGSIPAEDHAQRQRPDAELVAQARHLLQRHLYLGLPLLQAWDVGHLRALVAHELGHGSPRLGRLAPLAYRGRVAVGRTVTRISRRNLAGPILLAYSRWYRRVDAPFSRAHELAADGLAAQFAGPAAMAGVLRDLPILDAAQRLFYAEYVGPGWQAGHVPDDIFGGFLRALAARADELAAWRARGPAEAPSAWDTHPTTVDRLAALAAADRGR